MVEFFKQKPWQNDEKEENSLTFGDFDSLSDEYNELFDVGGNHSQFRHKRQTASDSSQRISTTKKKRRSDTQRNNTEPVSQNMEVPGVENTPPRKNNDRLNASQCVISQSKVARNLLPEFNLHQPVTDLPETTVKQINSITNSSTWSYKDVLLQKPAQTREQLHSNELQKEPVESKKCKKITPTLKLKIDHMMSDTGGAFLFLCGKCLMGNGKFPRMKVKSSKGNFCDTADRHSWDSSKVMVHRLPNKAPLLIRPRPEGMYPEVRAKMCPEVQTNTCSNVYGCKWGDSCWRAHNEVEIKVWNLGNVSYQDIVKRCSAEKPVMGFWCSYCNKTFQVKWEMEQHINTPEHMENIALDKERPWLYRDSPDNITNGTYELCPSLNTITRCMFSDVVPVDNLCPKAHSVEELEEWRERHQYRQMKIVKAREQHIFSFMNELQNQYRSTDTEIDVISEEAPEGVIIDCDHELVQYIESTTAGIYTFMWTFSIESPNKTPLIRVGLLHDEYRLHFCLTSSNNVAEMQVCPGKKIAVLPNPTGCKYHINVMFKSKMIGRYEQWVIFDFGAKPVVKRGFIVHSGVKHSDVMPVSKSGKILRVWDGSNTKIIPYDQYRDEETKELETKYKLTDFQVEIHRNSSSLTKETYKSEMHHFLRLEEKTRNEKLVKFCMETDMEVNTMVSIESAADSPYLFAHDGQLFGKIDISQSVFDDSDASQIALNSVQIVLVKFDTTSSTVYEAKIIMANADGRTKDAIYVQLPANCVTDNVLVSGKKISVQIQFRLNRLQFCIMRWAVDQIISTSILFPTKNEHPALICPQAPDVGSKLNRVQEGAVRFIKEKGGLNSKTPLLLLYGPFGTGKTYTLANGIMSALTNTETRILICTYTNSAADLYITEYLDSFVKNWSSHEFSMDMLRVYATERDKRTIPEKVWPYMIFDSNGCIRKLDEWDVRGKRIVVTTTSSSTQLASFPRLRGYFTHIIMDEAAQVLETEAIIPLILAIPSTCVVLAGDHMQMGPTVYSKQAHDMNFHHSLLERLFQHCLEKRCHRQILLRNNYRSHKQILEFLSKVFYSAEDMEACGNQPRHPKYYPLEFRAVKGSDMIIGNSYVNNYEVFETAFRVQEILDNWPEDSWGPKSEEEIGVFTPYRLQVQQLRRELRNRGLRRVSVHRLQDVQGKQFRVVIINTVRTQHNINKKNDEPETQYYLGFLSDMKQLNTAFTRSQSLVVVVGNPIALCSIGECCNVWKKYIKECEHNESLYPQGTAYTDIRLEISAATTVLDPNAVSFTPKAYACSDNPLESKLDHPGPSCQAIPNIPINKELSDKESDDDINFNTNDVILQELRRQLRKDIRRKDGEESDNSDYETDDEVSEQFVSPSKIRMIEEDDHVRVVQMDDDNNGKEEIATGKTIMCIFRMDLDFRRYAVPIEPSVEITEITIGTHTQRGTAMDGDEVLVEILANGDTEEKKRNTEKESKIYGKVVNVEKRAVDLTDKELVCLADPFSDNLMVPVNRRLPKIMTIKPKGKTRAVGHLIVPICRWRINGAIRQRDVVVKNKDRPHKLFIVRWLSWKKPRHYPLGIVIDDLPPGDNKTDGLTNLKRIYEVQHQDTSEDFLVKYPQNWLIPEEEYRRRKDLRDLVVFTVDPPDAQDLDDALSIQKLRKDTYKVGVHIADVSYFVQSGTDMDAKARKMATSFYPAFDRAIHMLPSRLGTNLCSLKPDQDRLAISVFLTFENSKLVTKETQLMRTVIQSKIQLTYDEAEKIIVGDNVHENGLQERLVTLSRLAWARRKTRLGKAMFSHTGSLDTVSHPKAHTMVEEMMLLVNENVAIFLLSKHPQCTPLRRQLPPLIDNFHSWKEENHERIEQSLHLTHRKEILEDILKDDNRPYEDESNDDVDVIRIVHKTWHDIRMCIQESQLDLHRLGGLVCSDHYHPQLAPIHSALHRILQKGEYICSSGHTQATHIHSDLHMLAYTHFTSPIRRYIDIVVHRLLVAILNNDTNLPYDEKELADISHNCNIRRHTARQFEFQTHALKLALELKQQHKQLHAVIEGLNDKGIILRFSHDKVAEAIKHCSVAFSLLKPIVKPELEEGDKTVVVEWKERIYNVRQIPSLTAHDIRANQSKQVKLQVDNDDQFTIEISADRWQLINRAILHENPLEIVRQIQEVECVIASQKTTEEFELRGTVKVKDVTCEINNCRRGNTTKKKKLYVRFKHEFNVGNVVKVQLYPALNRGMFSPNVHLFQKTPTLDDCLEHRSNPVQCFSEIADHVTNRKNIVTYKETWLPIIDMMAAHNAVQQNETVVIHCVKIEWQHHSSISHPTGSFTLLKTFCEDRHIKLYQGKLSGSKSAYLCIRYSYNQQDVCSSTTEEYQAVTFVAHAYTLDVKETEDKKDQDKSTFTIFFEVNQMSSTFPRILRNSGREPNECTVEFIPMSYPDSRLESAVHGVDTTSSLVQSICLLKPKEADYDEKHDASDMRILVSEARKRDIGHLNLNQSQTEAVKEALTQRFTVIQGPPGTGKTFIGACLVFLFTEQNKHLTSRGKERPKILYCGPSNKSVDVVAEYLKEFKIRTVRVYSKGIESREFPIPGLPSPTGKMDSKDTAMDPRHKHISLHHLIRIKNRTDGLKPNSRCEAIHEYDMRFQTPDYEPDRQELKAYHKLISDAEKEELEKYQVLLTTCNAAGSQRIFTDTNIIQCIVDEAGMCSEPETLIPLVLTKPLQIVLIGDHKQLRPIIQEQTARLLEMEISLLQRYAKIQMKMLTVQYRMHEKICYFPSTAFYDGRLITSPIVKKRPSVIPRGIWPGDGSCPIAFCHCTGVEETLTVRTAEGNEMSKANQYEVDQVVRLTKVLVDVHKIHAQSIVILSQYRLQCDRISKALAACGKSDVSVRTVVSSQGSEWDCVILSTVRSLPLVEIEENPNIGWRKKFLGFITDENQMNVALTRARHGLIIVGNKYLLRTHKRWKELLEHYEDNNCLVDANTFLRRRRGRRY